MKTKVFQKLLLSLTMASMLFFQNCTQENVIEGETKVELNDSQVVRELIKMGYKKDAILELENFYLVEGDILFSKNINDYTQKNELQQRHAYTSKTGIVSQENIASMTVFIHESIPLLGADNWRSEISQAINDWNTMGNNLIDFTLSNNPNSDIIIKSTIGSRVDGAIYPSLIAVAEFPLNQKPGDTILINPYFRNKNNTKASSSQKRYNMVHELGHCIGFRHTNWEIADDAESKEHKEHGATVIPGTPSQDPNSVMNGGTADFIWNGFSVFDIVAADFLYGKPISISGTSPICNSSIETYTLEGNTNNYPVNWTTSLNLQVVSLANGSVNVKPINSLINGEAFIEAKIGRQISRKNIWIGKPRIPTDITFLT